MPKVTFKMLISYLAILVTLLTWQDASARPADCGKGSANETNHTIANLLKGAHIIGLTPKAAEGMKRHVTKCGDSTSKSGKELLANLDAWIAQEKKEEEVRKMQYRTSHSDEVDPTRLPLASIQCNEARMEAEYRQEGLQSEYESVRAYCRIMLPRTQRLVAICEESKAFDTTGLSKKELEAFDRSVDSKTRAVFEQETAEQEQRIQQRADADPAFKEQLRRQKQQDDRLRAMTDQQRDAYYAAGRAALREMFPAPPTEEQTRFAAEERHRQWQRNRADELNMQRLQDERNQQIRDMQLRSSIESLRPKSWETPPEKPFFAPGVPPGPAPFPAPPGCRTVNVNGEWFQVCQ